MIIQNIPIITTPIEPRIDDRVATSGASTIKITMPCTLEVITDTVHSNAWALLTPVHVGIRGRDGSTPGHCNIDVRYPRLNSPGLIIGITISPTKTWIQAIVSPHGSTGFLKFGDTQIFETSINDNLAQDEDSTTIFNKILGQELAHDSSTDVYSRCRVDFTSNAVGTEAPEFMHLGLLELNTSDELRSFDTPVTKVGRLMDVSNWSETGHVFEEITTAGMSGTRSE